MFLHQVTSGAAHFKYQRHLYSAKPDEMPGKRCSSFSEKEIRGKVSWRLISTPTKACALSSFMNCVWFFADIKRGNVIAR